MKGIVWGKDLDTAKNKLTNIINNYVLMYNEEIIDEIYCTKNKYFVRFSNGDEWQAVKVHDASRGFRCNVSYIDSKIIDEDMINIIYNSTSAMPFQAFEVY